MTDLRDATAGQLLAEVLRRCEDDELSSDELTETLQAYICGGHRAIMEAVRDASWTYEDLIGEEAIEEFRAQGRRDSEILPELQAICYARRPEDLAHALRQVEAILTEAKIFGPYLTQTRML